MKHSYADLTSKFSASLSTECHDGTHACVDQATCLQSNKSSGYLCQCPAGQIGDGFEPDSGGDGCSDDCQLFQGKDSTSYEIHKSNRLFVHNVQDKAFLSDEQLTARTKNL